MAPHPAAELIAAYLSGTLSPTEVAALEGHVAGCRACRMEVTSARRVLRSNTRATGWWLAAPAVAAALLVALLARGAGTPSPERDTVRAGRDAGTAVGLSALAPTDRRTVPRRNILFVWSSHPGQTVFHLTLVDESGRAVWLGETPDTTLALPSDVTLEAGQPYYWYVDALDANGGPLTTGTSRFTVAP